MHTSPLANSFNSAYFVKQWSLQSNQPSKTREQQQVSFREAIFRDIEGCFLDGLRGQRVLWISKREGPVPGYQLPQRKLSQADDTFMLLCIVSYGNLSFTVLYTPALDPTGFPILHTRSQCAHQRTGIQTGDEIKHGATLVGERSVYTVQCFSIHICHCPPIRPLLPRGSGRSRRCHQ